MENQKCPSCGMSKPRWRENEGRGFSKGDQRYCCQGCATGAGCTCH